MGSMTTREGVQVTTAIGERDGQGRAPGKQTRSGEHGGGGAMAAAPASIQLRSAGPRGAGDWEMTDGLMAAMGLGGHDGAAEAAPVQRKAAGTAPVAPIQAHGLTGGGSIPDVAPSGAGAPLPEPVLQKMEGAFDTSFADVRVHQGGNAAQLGALAYAQGNDLHFAPGQYDPGSESGQRLIGHELTHVVQQRQGRVARQGKDSPINSDASLEAEADELGDRAARGEPVRPSGATGSGGVQRAVIQRKGETLAEPARLYAEGKGVVLTPTSSKDSFNLAHKEGEMDMWVNKTGKSMSANPEFEQKARRFEARLGQHLANDSAPVLAMAAALTTRARAVAAAAIEAKHATARKDLGEWFGSDGVTRIGAVGKDEAVLEEVFKEGNLRERMTVIFNFMWAFSQYLIDLDDKAIGQITKDTKLDGEAFLNKTAIMKDHALVKRHAEDEPPPPSEQSGPKKEPKKKGQARDRETLTSTPDPNLIVGQQYETRAKSGATGEATKSGLTTAELMQTHKLSERELRHMFEDQETEDGELAKTHANDKVPWEMGYQLWAMNENHEWVQTMRKLSLPVTAGPSATAWRMVKTAKHLGFGDRATLDMVRLAAAGYLLTIGAHSLIEILDGAAPEGVSPHNRDETIYTNLPPLPTSFLREQIAEGRVPHEPPEDRSLNTPKNERPQDLDGESAKLATIVSDKQDPLLPQGTTAKYTAQYLDGKKVDQDAYRMDWYWIDAAQADTEQPRAVATADGVNEWQHKWSKAGQYKIFCVLYKVNRELTATSPLTPLGVLRFDHGVAPSTETPKKHVPTRKKEEVVVDKEEDDDDGYVFGSDAYDIFADHSSDVSVDNSVGNSNAPVIQLPPQQEPKKEVPAKGVPVTKAPMMAWHRSARDEIVVLPVTAIYFDEHDTGRWNAKLTVPAGIEISKGKELSKAKSETVDYYAPAFEGEPVDAVRRAIELWRQDMISSKPQCDYPQGRLDLKGVVGEEAVREQFFLIGAPDDAEPVRENIPTMRVQGGELGGQNATWVQLIPDDKQGLDVVHQATAWTNFGDIARTIKWLDKRTDRAYCLYVEVESSYLQGLAEHAIPEATFIGLRAELAMHLRALKTLHSDKIGQFIAEIEDRPDQLNAEKVGKSVEEFDANKPVEEREKEKYAEVALKEMSVLMQKAEELLLKIEELNSRIESGESAILSSDAATHQYGVTDRSELQKHTVGGSARELYQMRTLHLEKSLTGPRSVGKPVEDFSRRDYHKMRNIPFIGLTPEDSDAGVRIVNFGPDSPAEKAGLKVGDIILGLGGQLVATVAEYTKQLAKLEVEKPAGVYFRRNIATHELQVTPRKP